MNHRITVAATGIAAAATSTVMSVSPAVAWEPCSDSQDRCSPAQVSPYAEPIDALGGRTMAQYVADHHAADPRSATRG